MTPELVPVKPLKSKLVYPAGAGKRHPCYYRYDRTDIKVAEFERLKAKFNFDIDEVYTDAYEHQTYEYKTRTDRGIRCWWLVEEYETFVNVTGPIPDNDIEEERRNYGLGVER